MIEGYKILEELSCSSKSRVVKALRIEDQLPVILKIKSVQSAILPRGCSLEKEFEIGKKIDGVRTPTYLSLQYFGENLVLEMQDENLTSLKKIKGKGAFYFNNEEVLKLCIEITKALSEIHDAQVIHKDICPNNILYNRETGKIAIADFGISTELSKENASISTFDVLEGTILYISPEQTGRMNRYIDYRSDFYSLGVVFYELATGNVPFMFDDPLEIVHCHIAKRPVSPVEHNQSMPLSFAQVILKLLEKSAEDRYQSTWGILADLEQCLDFVQNGKSSDLFSLGMKDFSSQLLIPQKLYGRDEHIDSLLSSFERIASGSVEILMLTGESGIGKSALVKEIYKSLTAKRGFFISGKFDQMQKNNPFTAIISAFNELAQQILTGTEEEVSFWREKILLSVGKNGKLITDIIPNIEHIIGEQPPVQELNPLESENRFNLVMLHFVQTFCSSQHPLVLFVDDLQWVDRPTLNLIETLTADYRSSSLFIIGAYRDNEVDTSHPLIKTLDKIRDENVAINQIALGPLMKDDIRKLLSESLRCSEKNAEELSRVVLHKTEGNPFFVSQFLQTLYEEDCIHFIKPSEEQAGHWSWDTEEIERINITDNVVELMIDKLLKLSPESQKIASYAACVGGVYDLKTLSLLYKASLIKTYKVLLPLLHEGLILPQSELVYFEDADGESGLIVHTFIFCHDRVQEASYSLIDKKERANTHLHIGRLLLGTSESDKDVENIFEVVEQFNNGISIITDPNELQTLAQLNLQASQKAIKSNAYNASLLYLECAQKCLTDDSWETAYDLTLAIYSQIVAVTYILGDYSTMEKVSDLVIESCTDVIHEYPVYKNRILAHIAQNRHRNSLEQGIEYLEKIGIKLSLKPNMFQVLAALVKLKAHLWGKSSNTILSLPKMSDVKMLIAMDLMDKMASPAYMISPNLFIQLTEKLVWLSVKYGNAPESCVAYNIAAMVFDFIFNQTNKAINLGQSGMTLVNDFGEHETKEGTNFVFYACLYYYKNSYTITSQKLYDNYLRCLEKGNVEIGGNCLFASYACLFGSGSNLNTLHKNMKDDLSRLVKLNQKMPEDYFRMELQGISNLHINRAEPYMLQGEYFHKELITNDENQMTWYYYYYFQSLLFYMFYKYDKANEFVTAGLKYNDSGFGFVGYDSTLFVQSLTYLREYGKRFHKVLNKVRKNLELLSIRAKMCPENVMDKYTLLCAEYSRFVDNKPVKAGGLYNKAIQEAHRYNSTFIEALANELAGQYQLDQSNEKIAELYLKEAVVLYRLWGAESKVMHLQETYPEILSNSNMASGQTTHLNSDSHAINSTTSFSSSSTEWMDIDTVMKTAHTLAGEVVLEDLLSKVMKLVIENAGAGKGYLLLLKDGQWFIDARGYVDSSQNAVLESLHIEESDFVAESVVRYVSRTREILSLENAFGDSRFSNDKHIEKHQTKSVLCAPLLNQGTLIGILYLENDLSIGAFRRNQAEFLLFLASQAAISIENAKFYQELEEKVAERTEAISEILNNIDEGLLTFNLDGSINPEYSVRANKILKVDDVSQFHLATLLNVDKDKLSIWLQFIANKKKSMKWDKLAHLAPIHELVFRESGESENTNYVALRFKGIQNEKGTIDKVMLLAKDVTDSRETEKKLQEEKVIHESEMKTILGIANTPKDELLFYLDDTNKRLENVNRRLENQVAGINYTSNFKGAFDSIYRDVHTIKGNSSSYGFDLMSSIAHKTEEELEKLRNRDTEKNEEIVSTIMTLLEDLKTSLLKINETMHMLYGKNGTKSVSLPEELVLEIQGLSHRIAVKYVDDNMVQELTNKALTLTWKPLKRLAQKYKNIVNFAAHKLNKKVTFTIKEENRLLPPDFLHQYDDILIHIIRNAIDHGLESNDIRAGLGKGVGEITLSVDIVKESVIIIVSDNGSGIDSEILVQKALKNGLINEQDADRLNEKEKLELIYKSGLSTASKISDISGRGVGMDVVKLKVDELHGTLDIDTKIGVGTSFILTFPKS